MAKAKTSSNGASSIDWAIYYLACLLSLGTVYLIRVIITIGVEKAKE